jgi:beta-1,4-N-acetylglucosaminyltransferase
MMMTKKRGDQELGLIISHAGVLCYTQSLFDIVMVGRNSYIVVGTGTILAAMRLGVPLIVVPNPDLADDHQQELAQVLNDQKYVVSSSVQ